MALPRTHLTNAPIVEALVDVRVSPRPDVVPAEFQKLAVQFATDFPLRAQQFEFQQTFQLGVGGSPPPPSQTISGWMLRSEERAAIAQFRADGFTYNKLAPYTNWEEVSGEALRLWRAYAAEARPTEITRLAVRYINQLLLPLADLKDYLEAPPAAPPQWPKALEGFLFRWILRDPARDARAVVTQTMGGPAGPGQVQVILDVDVFREGHFDADLNVEDALQPLGRLKNEVFFASLTEKAIAQYL
ncbi:MAG TPA: TIGR04255 family protein [Terriglobales bacterium]|nr:TIGR04255 family protein [Terriglobales bacterium]